MTVIAKSTEGALTLYESHVKQALKWYHDPERIGTQSPLASPYFLSRALRDLQRPVTARMRGQILCAELRASAQQLWGEPLPTTREDMLKAIAIVRRNPNDARYSYVVLELRCFQRCIQISQTSDIWEQPHLLPGSKSQHYREFDKAVKQLSALLLDKLRPALRLERPLPPPALYGYARQLAMVVDALRDGQTITLRGPGGVGKTSLAATALTKLDRHPVFWYTLRPGVNDGASSLLFALGSFLHEQGASNLWQYLVTTNGVIGDLHLAAGLLRQDLASFVDPEQRPILCFDDLEHLSIGNLALAPAGQTQLSELIDGLRGLAPLLLISQRPLPTSELQIELTGLSIDDVIQLWQATGYTLSRAEAEQVHASALGNARMLTLMLTLQRQTGTAPNMASKDGAQSLLPAFQRLWRRLVPEERRALQKLSVYLSYAPEDILEPTIVESLTQLGLVERTDAGGVAVQPTLCPVIYDDLSPELREALHEKAAIAFLERGEYTAAAYHFSQSQQERCAVQVWFVQRRQAIARGEADAARPIFDRISRQRLDRSERKALDIIRAELRQLAGQYEAGLQELERADWPDESEASSHLWMLRGEMEDALGYPEQALNSYQAGIQVTTRLLSRLAALEQRRGILLLRRREVAQSWQELRRAEFDLAILHGNLLVEEGSHEAGLQANYRALELAEQLNDDSLRALAERQIARLYGRQQDLEQAVAHAARAMEIYERLGDRVNLEKMRSNLAFIYVQTRQFQSALEVGAIAYAFFTAVRDPYFAAVTGANLAEASYELGAYADAARYATGVLALDQKMAIPYARFTLGQIDLASHNPAGATVHFTASLQAAQENDDPFMVAYAERALGQAYLATGNTVAATQHLTSALALFRQIDMAGEIAATEKLIADLLGGYARLEGEYWPLLGDVQSCDR